MRKSFLFVSSLWGVLIILSAAPLVSQNTAVAQDTLDANTVDVTDAVVEPSESTGAEAEIRSRLRDYVDSFNDRDFDTLRSLMSADIHYRDVAQGKDSQTADALIERIQNAIEAEPDLKLDAVISEMQPHQGDVVQVRGTSTLRAPQTPDEDSAFTLVISKHDGEWIIESITEQAPIVSQAATSTDALESLRWLEGTWTDQSDSGLQSKIEFLPGGKFLRRTFQRETDDGKQQVGVEMVGYDPQVNLVRSWTFFQDGSFGRGVWSSGDDHWRIRSVQTLTDGGQAAGTFLMQPLDENTMTVKLVAREVNGEPQPSGKTVTLHRVVNESDANATSSESNQPQQ